MSKLVAVVGQGYVGLPLAMGAVDAGFDVIDVDRAPGDPRAEVEDASPSASSALVRRSFVRRTAPSIRG